MPRGYCPSDLSRSEIIAEARDEAIAAAAEDLNTEMREQLDAMTDDYDELVKVLQSVTTELAALYRKVDDIDPADTSPKEVAQKVHAIGDTVTALKERIWNVLDEVTA